MKKKILTAVMLLCLFSWSNAQVKIEVPNSSGVLPAEAALVNLEIAKTLNKDVADGILIPRLEVSQLDAKDNLYDELQNGTLVYVKPTVIGGEVKGTTGKKTQQINGEGFYYYNDQLKLWVDFYGTPGNGSFIPHEKEVLVGRPLGEVIDWSEINQYNYFSLIQDENMKDASINLPEAGLFTNRTIYIRNKARYISLIRVDKSQYIDHPKNDTKKVSPIGNLVAIETDSTIQLYSDGERWYIVAGKQ